MSFANFQDAVTFVEGASYLVIFLVMVLEGPVITLAAAFAASLGYFNIYIIGILSFFGNFLGDFIHYAIGYTGRRAVIERYSQKMGLKLKFMHRLERQLKRHLWKALLIIKVVPVLSNPGLLLAGVLKVPFWKFSYYAIVQAIPITLVLVLAGYYSGVGIGELMPYAQEGANILILVLVVAGLYFAYTAWFREPVRRWLRKLKHRLMRKEEME